MQNFNLIIIGILILFILFYSLYLFFRKKETKRRIITKTPSECEINPDDPQCFNLIKCGLLNKDTIKSCENDENICSKCQCTSDPTVKMNCMKCTASDGTFEIAVNKDECQDPFVWDETKNTCFLKKGKFCLPVNLNPDIPCSPYSANKVLIQADENSPIEWKCICKDDTKFVNSKNDNFNCVGINICNMQGKPNPKVFSANQRSLIKKGSKDNPVLWDGSNFDPLEEGECHCLENEDFDSENMTCKISSCSPYGILDPNDPRACICSPGYASCHLFNYLQDSTDLNFCKIPSCIPDPCVGIGADKSLKNKTIQTKHGIECSCDTQDGYYPYFDTSTHTFGTCAKLCSDENNPCKSGGIERGTCFVLDKFTKSLTEYNFDYITNFSLWSINTKVNDKTFYLNVNSDNNLVMTENEDVLFKIWFILDNKKYTRVPVTNGLSSGSSYFFEVYKNNNSIGYINFNSLKVESKTDIKEVIDNPDFIIIYKSEEKNDNKGQIKIGYDKDKKEYKYLIYDGQNLIIVPDITGTARCKCCRSDVGFTQDDTYLCQNSCNKDNSSLDVKYANYCGCCSGESNNQDNNDNIFNIINNRANDSCKASPNNISRLQFGNICGQKDYTFNNTIYSC